MELRQKRPQRRCALSSTGAPVNPQGLIEVGVVEHSTRAAGDLPPASSAVETAATQNEHENDDDQKSSAIQDRLLPETNLAMIGCEA